MKRKQKTEGKKNSFRTKFVILSKLQKMKRKSRRTKINKQDLRVVKREKLSEYKNEKKLFRDKNETKDKR